MMTHEELAYLERLVSILRGNGITKFETPDLCMELQPLGPPPVADVVAAGAEEEDFDPAKAYQEAVEKAAAAIVEANGKRS